MFSFLICSSDLLLSRFQKPFPYITVHSKCDKEIKITERIELELREIFNPSYLWPLSQGRHVNDT